MPEAELEQERIMEINGRTRTCGLIGNPVEHTMSPAIHNTLARIYGHDLAYLPFHVPAGGLEEAVKGAYALNFLGLNVTVPYKSQVIPFLKETDPLAREIGAVNTLVRVEGGFKGYNTDMPGLWRAMCQDNVALEGQKVLILGAGGVARAVALLAVRKGAGEVILLNRTLEKAQAVAEEVNALTGRTAARALALQEHAFLPTGEKYLAVQATNVGMYPRTQEAVIEDPSFYEKIQVGYDLIFNPARTRFMSLVEESGGRAWNGLKMLLYQGIIAYELWTGAEVVQAQAQEAFQAMIRAMGIL